MRTYFTERLHRERRQVLATSQRPTGTGSSEPRDSKEWRGIDVAAFLNEHSADAGRRPGRGEEWREGKLLVENA